MITKLFISTDQLDQYKDENVEVISSVVDIKDITKNTNAFTRTFTVPASRNNNIIFSHYYDANIDNSFDARTKVDGEIHLDGIVFKYGKFRLQKVNVKKNKPESYVINFFGNLVNLKDKARDKELSDLDTELSVYNHNFDDTTVYQGLTVGLPNVNIGDVIYTCMAKKYWFINSTSGTAAQTELRSNISFDNPDPTAGILWNDLRPSIKVIRLIEAIETNLDVTFSRDFFGTSEFLNLFMWLSPGKDSDIVGNTRGVDCDANVNANPNNPYDLATDICTVTRALDSRWTFNMNILPDAGFEDVTYGIQFYVDGELTANTTIPPGGTNPIDGSGNLFTDIGETYGTYDCTWEVSSQEDFEYTAFLTITEYYENYANKDSWGVTGSSQALDGDFIITSNMPKIKIIDFLKGIFQMYKLVVIPQDDGTLYVNTLNSYYAEGNTYDVTKYIDFESYDVSRGDILNEINFKFQDPTTIVNLQFKSLTGDAYGDLNQMIYDETGTELIDGDSFKVELPFEQVVYERLSDQADGVISDLQYGAIIDEDLAPANPAPHLHYKQSVSQGAKGIGYIEADGTRIQLTFPINLPMHAYDSSNSVSSTTFKAEINEWNNTVMDKNLYNNHYDDYISTIFNIKKRSFKFKAVLPLRIITKLDLNDILYIKGNYYRIDKHSYNLLTGETNFELFNSFDAVLNPYQTTSESILTDYEAKDELLYITNLDGNSSTFVINDLGDGTGWVNPVTYETSGTAENVLTLEIDENDTAAARSVSITATQAVTGATIIIYITQFSEVYYPSFDFSDSRNSMNTALLTLRN